MIIWLASYPKSGNTWIRSFLSAYYFSNDGMFNFNQLKNINQYPHKKFFDKKIDKPGDIHAHWDTSQKKIVKKKIPIILKTHNCLIPINGNNFTSTKYTLGVIYIVRDPRNIITSLKNHYEMSYDETLKFMTNEKKFIYDNRDKYNYASFHFLSSWSNHYKSWIKSNLFKTLTIKYEDLEKKPYETFRNLINFLNILMENQGPINESKIINCIKTTSFEQLKKNEQKYGFKEAVHSNKTNNRIDFFNLGFKNKWKKILPENLHKTVNEAFKDDLIFFEY